MFMSARLAILLLAVVLAVQVAAEHKCGGCATYKITFHSFWTAARFPTDFPAGNAHWSRMVGSSHDNRYELWAPGKLASQGVQNVAEQGDISAIKTEMESKLDGPVYRVFTAATGFSQPASYETSTDSFLVSGYQSLVSVVSMIAPSPDWFVGLHGVETCVNQKFVQVMNITAHLYDAGTDSGTTYTSGNSAQNPHVNIFRFTNTNPASGPFHNAAGPALHSFGYFLVQKIGDTITDSDACQKLEVSSSSSSSSSADTDGEVS
jgi:hypothetical protein